MERTHDYFDSNSASRLCTSISRHPAGVDLGYFLAIWLGFQEARAAGAEVSDRITYAVFRAIWYRTSS
jgi:hypothetical protein